MAYSKEQMKEDLYRLGLAAGDMVFMHSSFKSLGEVEGGAATVFAALQEVLTEEGTLILPAFSFDTVNKKQPVFSVKDTPVCVGYLPEYFRTQVKNVYRSIHPTHSCSAWGKYAQEITKDHYLDETPVGPHSPLYLLRKYGGKVLFLGCGIVNNTTIHGIEESIPVPYVFAPKEKWEYQIIPLNGEPYTAYHYRHLHNINGMHYNQNYKHLFEVLDPAVYKVGPVLASTSYLIVAEEMWKKGTEMMKKDPFCLVYPTPITE